MTQTDLIDEILRRNPSAKTQFLSRFPANELERYLHRLRAVNSAGVAASSLSFAQRANSSAAAAAGNMN